MAGMGARREERVPPTGISLSQAPSARPLGTCGYVHPCDVLCIAGHGGGMAGRPLTLPSLGAVG